MTRKRGPVCGQLFHDRYDRPGVCDLGVGHNGGHCGGHAHMVSNEILYEYPYDCHKCLGRGVVGEPGVPLFASAIQVTCSACGGSGRQKP